MKFSKLKAHATHCLKNNLSLQVLVDMPKFQDEPVLIVTPPENIEKNIEHYKDFYDKKCKHRYEKGVRISGVVHGSEELTAELKEGIGILSPLKPQLLENHIRYERSYNMGERGKSILIEGRVEDVLKIIDLEELD